MDKIILYHGSDKIISEPKYNYGKTYNDYGQGFYCTRHAELAREWAVDKDRDGFVNSYEIDLSGLKVLDLNSEKFTILNWLTVLLEHRKANISTPMALDGLNFLKHNYHINLNEFDVVVGYRADDSYFSFARAFVSNSISIGQLKDAMHLGELGLQYFIKSRKAFSQLHFLEALPVDSAKYYSLKSKRDAKARADFERIANSIDRKGAYLVDLMRKENADDTFI